MVALDAAARAGGEQLRPALEKERGARPAGHDAHQIGRVALGSPRSHGAEPSARHRLEDPQAQVVGEANLRQVVALGQVVEREEVDEREVAQHVDDRAPGVGLAHGARPRVVDLDALEEATVDPGEERVRLVRGERTPLAAAVGTAPVRLHLPWNTRCAIEATFFEESGVTPVCA